MNSTILFTIFTLLLLLYTLPITGSPIHQTEIQKRSIDTTNSLYQPNNLPQTNTNKTAKKKNVFLSRGWGAGGMPFSVLYMSPHSSKAPAHAEEAYKTLPVMQQSKEQRQKSLPQVRNSMSNSRRRQYSIPQLFVSYGWGPIGK